MGKSNQEMIMEEEINEKAELEAATDNNVQEDAENLETLNERLPYTVKLSKEYDFDGEVIGEVDLSGLEELTTRDAQEIERTMQKLNYHPQDKFRDITYTKHIARKVTGLPIEFFNSLKWKDMQAVTARIGVYFLF